MSKQYKYLPESELPLFGTEMPSWASPVLTGFRVTPIISNLYKYLEECMRKEQFGFEYIQLILKNRLPEHIHNYVLECERWVDTKLATYNQDGRQYYFDLHFLPKIRQYKAEHILFLSEKIIRSVWVNLNPQIKTTLEQNLQAFGLTFEDTLPLLKGKGSQEAYLNIAYCLAVSIEQKHLLPVFEFLESQLGDGVSINLSTAKDQAGRKVVTYQIVSKSQQSEPMHFPDVVYYAWNIIQKIRAGNVPQQLPETENAHTPKQLAE